MKIDDVVNNRELMNVGLGLTEAEAKELRDALGVLLEDASEPERHEHISSVEYDRELTIWIIRD